MMAGCFGMRAPLGCAVLSMVLALIVSAGSAAGDCTHAPVAELPLLPSDDGTPIVSLKIDGAPRTVLLDTGGFWSLIDPAIAQDFRHHRSGIVGQLGLQGIPLTRAVTVPSIEIGAAKVPDVDFFEEPAGYTPTAATLGANWLSHWDVEIDPAAGRATFYPLNRCRDDVGRWPHGELAEIPVTIDPRQRLVTIPLELDGLEVRALIDTGSPETFISARAAKLLFGIDGDSSGLEAEIGRAGQARQVYRHRFHALRMGDIVFRDPWLVVAPMEGNNPDMILGMHDLSSLHLYFAYGERKLYASTVRGDDAARNGPPSAAQRSGRIDITSSRDYMLTAEEALKRKDYDGALIALNASVRSEPGNVDAYLERAELFGLEGQRDRAFADADRALALDPRSVTGFVVKSELESVAGEPDRALADATHAIEIDSNSEMAYAARAEAYAAKRQWDRAMRDSSAAIRVAPNSVAGYLSRSHIYELAGDYAHALEDADQAVHLQPKSATALNARCWNGAILDRLDMALDDCNAAVALRPYSAEILDSRAFVNLQSGKYDLALADYNAALAINPRFASSLYGRGLAKRRKGDPAGSRIDIAAAQAIDPQIAQRFGK